MKNIGFSGFETPSKQAYPSLGLILKNTFYLKMTKNTKNCRNGKGNQENSKNRQRYCSNSAKNDSSNNTNDSSVELDNFGGLK
jgi:hypothetical protein